MPQISPRAELLALQKRIYRKNKQMIRESVIPEDNTFEAYERRYLKGVRNYKEIVSPEEVVSESLQANIVYVGDYHTLNQSQRSFLRLLRMCVKKTTNFCIALEVIHARHQVLLDKYMKGKIGDLAFLKKIGFREHWFFDLWDNFRPIFDLSRYYHIPLYGIEPSTENYLSLKDRDAESARRIFEIYSQNPERTIFVFMGDLHLASKHLPLEVKKIFCREKISIKTTTLFQNSDAIYWKLAEKELEDKVLAVRISANEFCRLHTPPIICQQSFLNWLEHEGEVLDYADAKETFLGYMDRIAAFLGVELGPEKEDVQVFTAGDLSFLKRLRESKAFGPKEIREIKRQILRSESYTIPKEKIVYLADVSVNHAAEEAAHMIRHFCAGREFPRPMQDAFYANILHEALAFFGSKVINHRRKCPRPADFRKIIIYLEKSRVVRTRQLEYMTARLFLEHMDKAKRREPFHANKIAPFSTDLFLSLTHAIAYELGEKLFYGLLDGHVAKEYVRELHEDPMVEEGETVYRYFQLLDKLKGVRLPKKL